MKSSATLRMLFRFAFLAGVLCLSLSCTNSKRNVAEAPATTSATPIVESQQVAKTASPPNLKAVEEAVSRVFKSAAVVDTSRKPAFIAGDFNGDQSTDLAVVLKPSAEKIAEMNEEYPNWMLRNPFGSNEKSPRLRIGAEDILLAVIHGYGAEGWRDPQATQTYLLKDSVGTNMETQSANDLRRVNAGKKIPQLKGDVIGEVIQGKQGYLYYASSSYGWYDPQTFTGEPEIRRGHGGIAPRPNR